MYNIGLFDSGIGGFSILEQLDLSMSSVCFHYIADHQFAPYGNKDAYQIINRSTQLVEILLERGVDLIVVACNTATAMAINTLRERFPQISFVGIEPYLNVIHRHPELVDRYKGVVLSTVGTNCSNRFMQLRHRLDPKEHLDYIGLPNLASLIELFYIDKNLPKLEMEVEKHLNEFVKNKYDFAVLGCTHYPLIRELIEKVLDLRCYSPSKFVANRVVDILQYNRSDSVESHSVTHYYSTNSNQQWLEVNTSDLLSVFRSAIQ